jgi:hypothetical protein
VIKFAAGFATAWYIARNRVKIAEFLRRKEAELQLKQDILKHDNPELRG